MTLTTQHLYCSPCANAVPMTEEATAVCTVCGKDLKPPAGLASRITLRYPDALADAFLVERRAEAQTLEDLLETAPEHTTAVIERLGDFAANLETLAYVLRTNTEHARREYVRRTHNLARDLQSEQERTERDPEREPSQYGTVQGGGSQVDTAAAAYRAARDTELQVLSILNYEQEVTR